MKAIFIVKLCFLASLTIILFTSASFQQSESELSKLMRVMSEDMKKMKVSVSKGKPLKKWGENYTSIKTAKPSVDSKKGKHFDEYATGFLTQVDRMNTMEKGSPDLKANYNSLVQSCIRCHETYCPGPISMLKKLKLP